MKKVGLVDAHAYTLIGAKTITLDNGQEERLLQIRNPWGKKEWSGDWSDKSDKWTAHTKSQVNYVDEDDGTFWISFSDYTSFFYITTICFYKEQFEDNTVADMHEVGGFGLCKFKLDQDVTTPITFSFD